MHVPLYSQNSTIKMENKGYFYDFFLSTHVLLYEMKKKRNQLKLKANVVHVRSCIFIFKCILSFLSRSYRTVMLNSAQHEISTAYKKIK